MFYYVLLFKAKQRFAYLLLIQSVYLFLDVLFLFQSVFHFFKYYRSFANYRYRTHNNLGLLYGQQLHRDIVGVLPTTSHTQNCRSIANYRTHNIHIVGVLPSTGTAQTIM